MASRSPSPSPSNDDPSLMLQLAPGLESLEEARSSFRLNKNIVLYVFTNYVLFFSQSNSHHRWLLTHYLWDELWSHSLDIRTDIERCEERLVPGKECVVALGVDRSGRIRYHACLRSAESSEADQFDLINLRHGLLLTPSEWFDLVDLLPAVYISNNRFTCS